MEEVDDPVDGVDDMDHPGEVVDDVEEGVLVLDRLDGLVRVEDEEEEQHEQVQEAENGAPIAPESRSKNQKILERDQRHGNVNFENFVPIWVGVGEAWLDIYICNFSCEKFKSCFSASLTFSFELPTKLWPRCELLQDSTRKTCNKMCSAEKSLRENIFTRNRLKHVYEEKSVLPRKWEIPLEFVRKHPSQLTKEEKWTKILEKPAKGKKLMQQ